MFYRKNVPPLERLLRVGTGALVAAASLYMPLGTTLGWLAVASGVMLAGTGFIGFCPMCALFGRQLGPRS